VLSLENNLSTVFQIPF